MRGILITGAAKRLGAFVAKGLARQNWHVVLHYRKSEADAHTVATEIGQDGGAVSLVQGDLADEAARERVIDAAFAACPQLTALINNASVFEYDDVQTATQTRLETFFRVNAIAPLLLTRAFASRLQGPEPGCVIDMLDNRVLALNPDYFSYAVGKYALFGASRMMALALAPRIRINGIAPGITLPSGGQSQANFEAGHRMNPMGAGCTPDQILRAIEFILETPSYHGQILTIDGGETLAPHGRDVAFLNPDRP